MIKIMKTTYYVISTTNSQVEGWRIFGEGSKPECVTIQLTHADFQGTDIYADTLNKNSKIVPKGQLKKYGL